MSIKIEKDVKKTPEKPEVVNTEGNVEEKDVLIQIPPATPKTEQSISRRLVSPP